MGKYDPSPKRKRKRRTARRRTSTPKRRYRRRTYDPKRKPKKRSRKRKAKDFLAKIENKIVQHGRMLGFGLGFLLPAEMCRAKHGKDLKSFYFDGTIHETQALIQDPLNYLQWKFTGDPKQTSWSGAFMLSLGGWILSKVGILPSKVNTILGKISSGSLIATTLGALFILGGNPPPNTSSNTSTSTTTPNNINHYG